MHSTDDYCEHEGKVSGIVEASTVLNYTNSSPNGSKYPNMKQRPQNILMMPHTGTICMYVCIYLYLHRYIHYLHIYVLHISVLWTLRTRRDLQSNSDMPAGTNENPDYLGLPEVPNYSPISQNREYRQNHPKSINPMLPILSMLGYWAMILGFWEFQGP